MGREASGRLRGWLVLVGTHEDVEDQVSDGTAICFPLPGPAMALRRLMVAGGGRGAPQGWLSWEEQGFLMCMFDPVATGHASKGKRIGLRGLADSQGSQTH